MKTDCERIEEALREHRDGAGDKIVLDNGIVDGLASDVVDALLPLLDEVRREARSWPATVTYGPRPVSPRPAKCAACGQQFVASHVCLVRQQSRSDGH